MFRLAKEVIISSMSLSDDPPVDTMTGFFVFAIFSINIQSFRSELAILIIGMPSSTHRSTERSSKGVADGIQPALRIALTRIAYLIVGKPCIQCLLDIPKIGTANEVFMDE